MPFNSAFKIADFSAFITACNVPLDATDADSYNAALYATFSKPN
jgi:hypothetical protein